MKKRIFAFLLCAVLLTVLLPGAAGAADAPLSLIAIDDTLPQELINAVLYYGGTVYVPSWLFRNYDLGITYSYFTGSTTAYLDSAGGQLFFNVTTGRTFDGDDFYYSASAMVQGGTVYLPLSFVCSFFGGFSYANIGGNEYGNVLRIDTGASELTNDEFLRVAKPAMKRYYDAYYATKNPGIQTPEPTEQQTHEGDTVHLGLLGMPRAETLSLLERLDMEVCFFLSAEDIRSDPNLVRCIACRGFGLGVRCETGSTEEFLDTAALLWEATRVRSCLAVLPEGTEPIPEAVCRFAPEPVAAETDRMAETYSVTAKLNASSGDTALLFPCGEEHATALNMLIYYLHDQNFRVTALRETDQG